MARIRTVKPEIALHEGLFELEQETGLPIRFAWCMLFCHCDREGRFEWRPRRLGAQILPFDEVDFSRVLDAWATRGFVRRYRVGEEWFGDVPSWRRHQVINNRESESEIPDISEADEVVTDACATREPRVPDGMSKSKSGREGKGKERKGKELGSSEVGGSGGKGSNGQGTRLPDDWTLTDERLAYGTSKGLTETQVRHEHDKFTDYWRSCPGQRGRKSDWDATWRNWTRRAAEQEARGNGKPPNGDARPDDPGPDTQGRFPYKADGTPNLEYRGGSYWK